jgi:hypothetical protein
MLVSSLNLRISIRTPKQNSGLWWFSDELWRFSDELWRFSDELLRFSGGVLVFDNFTAVQTDIWSMKTSAHLSLEHTAYLNSLRIQNSGDL